MDPAMWTSALSSLSSLSSTFSVLEPVTASVLGSIYDNYDAETFDHAVVNFLVFFGLLYGLTYAACRAVCGLKAKTSSLIGTCACSFVHGLFCILVGIEVLFLGRFVEDKRLDHVNLVLETYMMQFSLAYLLFDTVFSITDPLFLAHHFLSISYLISVLRLGVGGSSTVFVFFIGEVTSPVFNSFTVLNEIRREYRYPWARRLFRLVSPVFTFSFILVRTFISIPLVAWYSKRLLFDSPAIPLAYRMGMQALVTAGLGGSQVWSWRLYRGWVRSRATEKKGE